MTEPGPGRRPVARGEQAVVDPGGQHLDTVGIGAVERAQQAGLLTGGGQDQVGAADDVGLTLDPAGHLVAGGHPAPLHQRQRVEGGHHRQRQLVLQAVGRLARQPVVGVEDLVVAPAPPDLTEHRLGELVDEPGQALLGDGRGGPGRHIEHPEVGLDRDHPGLPRVLGPGVDVAGDAGPGQGRGQRPDVDVHPPAVTDARLGHRGGVEGEDGHAPYGHGRESYRWGEVAP